MSELSTLRISLDDGEFLIDLRKVKESLKDTSESGTKGFSKLGKGIEGAKGAAKALGGTLKKVVGTVGALGGAFSAMEGTKKAIELDATYRRLAFSISVATKEQTTAADVQRDVTQAAGNTTRTSEEMAEAFREVFGATKDLQFARDVLETIGRTATASGAEVATVAELAQKMQRKFSVSAAEMEQAMTQVFEQAQQGGPSFEQMSEVMDEVGAALIGAGLDGKKGLDFMLGALNATDGQMASLGAQVSGLKNLMVKLGDPNAVKAIGEAAGLSSKELFNEKDVLSRLKRIMSQGQKGLDALRVTLAGPEERDALRILFTDPFEKALQKAQASGLRGRDAIERSMRVLEGQIDQFGKGTLTVAQMQEQAAKEAQSPTANFRQAMESLTQAMAQPEIIAGINDLSKHLPDLAKAFGNVMSFAARNPILAGALGIGGRVGAGFFAGAAREAGKELVAKFGDQAKKAAVDFAGSASKELVKAAGGPFGKVAGVAIAGAVALAVKEEIDKAFNESGKQQREEVLAAVAGGPPRSEKERQAQLKRARSALSELEKGSGFFDTIMGGLTGTREQQVNQDINRMIMLDERIAKLEGMGPIGTDAGGSESLVVAAPAAKAPSKVGLDSQAPHLIAKAIANELKGTTLSVAMSTHGGVPAQAIGGRGPRMMPAVQQGGGL